MNRVKNSFNREITTKLCKELFLIKIGGITRVIIEMRQQYAHTRIRIAALDTMTV